MSVIRVVIAYFAAVVMCDHFWSSQGEKVYIDIGESTNLSCIEENANRILSCMFERFDYKGVKDLELGEASMVEAEERATYLGNGIDTCAFELKNVTPSDVTLWKGTLGYKRDEDHQSYLICKVRLIQKVAPTFLEIQNKSQLERIIDEDESRNDNITLKCCADKAAAPPPELAFVYDGYAVQNTIYDEAEHCLILTNISFSREETNKQLNCTLKHPMLEYDLMDSVTINVEYGPVLLKENDDCFVVEANPVPEVSPETFRIEKQTDSVNKWDVCPIVFIESDEIYNVSVSNTYKTIFVPYVMPKATTTTTTTTTQRPTTVSFSTEAGKIVETTTSQKPTIPKPTKQWTPTKIVLVVLGVILGLILLTLILLYLAYQKGLLGTVHLIPTPDYADADAQPVVQFQASPGNVEF